MSRERSTGHQTPQRALGIPARWTPEIQSLARIIVGFLVFRHGMEQVLGFPAAGTDVPTMSWYGLLKLLCFPGGLLLMLGLLTRPTTLTLAIAHVGYWLIEPLPQAVFEGARLVGSRGAPSDHLLLPGLFCLYLFFAGAGAWSLDRWLKRDALPGANLQTAMYAMYALVALRIVAGILFIPHGTGKISPTLDPMSTRALAMVLELVGGPLLIVGLYVRPVAFILSGEMAFAYFMSHAPLGFWGSFAVPNQEAAILFCYLFLFFWATGAGAFSLDAVLERRRGRSASAPLPAPTTA
jgi:putative oxidoreductase